MAKRNRVSDEVKLIREMRKDINALNALDPDGAYGRELEWHRKYRLAVVGEYREWTGATVTQIDYVPKVK